MTKQQEIQLKEGDEVFVKAVFDSLASDGDAYVRYFWTNGRGERVSGLISATSDSVFLRSDLQQPEEKPKYDPCRRFKKGDIVTPLARGGREVPDGAPVGEKCTVIEPEKNGIVRIHYVAGSVHFIYALPFYYLELVTPVEELEPYSVEESGGGATLNCFIVKRGKKHVSYYLYKRGNANHYYTYAQAKAAAEAECDRLNAEHRKELA